MGTTVMEGITFNIAVFTLDEDLTDVTLRTYNE